MHYYTLRQMALSDWTTGVNTAFEKGVVEGMEKGIAQGIARGLEKGMERGFLDSARRLKAAGVALEDIALFTGLSAEQIARL
jgi:predicted transposase/invertase (TIGR01784 family)